MTDREEFEDIYIAGLVRETSHYDPESDQHDIALRLSDEPSDEWTYLLKDRLDSGPPDGQPMEGRIDDDVVVVRSVSIGRFEATILPFLKESCRRTNQDYRLALAKQAKDAEAVAERRAKLDAKREQAKQDLAKLAERIEAKRGDGEEE